MSAALPIEVVDHYQDKRWRLWNLYWIINERGERIKFEPNWVQQDLLDELWYLTLCIKSRQLGVTTLVDLWLLDDSLFNANVSGAIIADNERKATEIFREKIRFPYDNLPLGLRRARYLETNQSHTLVFDNKSRVTVGVSVRGLTFQNLHVSELGRISRYFPQRAEEIRTGALNTVHAGQMIFIESTTEGREGLLYELFERADQLKQEGRALTPLDFKLHFYPWYLDERYTLSDEDAAKVTITEEDERYFAEVEAEMDVELTPGQRAWYIAKRSNQGDKMKQEFPSTPREPFEASNEGKIFRKEMEQVRREGRIQARIPVLSEIPVNVFFDIGGASNRLGADYMACWFCQRVAHENRMLRSHRDTGRGIGWWTTFIKSHGYLLGKLYLPHDAKHKRLTLQDAGKSVEDLFLEAGWAAKDIVVLDRVENKWHDGIGTSRNVFPTVVFDKEHCDQGIKDLDNYTKVWNEQVGAWRDLPAHNEASHGADAFETFARSDAALRGVTRTGTTTAKRRRPRSWRTI